MPLGKQVARGMGHKKRCLLSDSGCNVCKREWITRKQALCTGLGKSGCVYVPKDKMMEESIITINNRLVMAVSQNTKPKR